MSDLVPEDWEVLTIESVLDNIIDYRGKSPPKSEAGIPLITAKNVRKGYIDEEPREFIYENQFDTWMVRGTPRYGDVFITTEAPLGNIAKVPKYKFAIGQRLLALSPSADILSSDFLLQILQGEKFTEQLDLQSTGSTVAGIKQSTFRKMPLPIPPLPEQQKIAAILSSVDEVIEKTQAQINKLKDLKTGMMQELLSPREGQAANINNPQGESKNGLHHTEFKDSPLGRIPVGWEVKHLEQLVNPDKNITYGIVQAGPHCDDGVPYIRVTDMSSRHLSRNEMLLTSQAIAEKYKRSAVSTGDIVYALRGLIGHVLPVPSELHNANLTQGTARISPNEDINSDYLLWALRSSYVAYQNDMEAKGSTFREVTLASLRKIQICTPPKMEQEKLSCVLNGIESKTFIIEDRLIQLKSLKKALMQDLLTGKVRVQVDAS